MRPNFFGAPRPGTSDFLMRLVAVWPVWRPGEASLRRR